ncbi:transmembrane protein 33 isoform X2 [Phyllopteryx taeniolatus]|uniref:transmembrane protein 33 isoform X2 n=1 Tax=Phyllopteryx taeniolatus TaxID=161469 RepID=UPI002AD5113A|nr:transmembrane protein 33 isoform X2 [Phyllopteryx taeniolatus]
MCRRSNSWPLLNVLGGNPNHLCFRTPGPHNNYSKRRETSLEETLEDQSLIHYELQLPVEVYLSIFPVFLFSLLHATTYTKKVLDSVGPSSLMFIRNLLDKMSANQQNILKFIACNEIFLMPATVFMLFSGQGSLLLPFIYYRFLSLRYTSRRNPYCRTLFTELRIILEHFIMKPACPAFFRRMCLSSIAFVSRLAPTGV